MMWPTPNHHKDLWKDFKAQNAISSEGIGAPSKYLSFGMIVANACIMVTVCWIDNLFRA